MCKLRIYWIPIFSFIAIGSLQALEKKPKERISDLISEVRKTRLKWSHPYGYKHCSTCNGRGSVLGRTITVTDVSYGRPGGTNNATGAFRKLTGTRASKRKRQIPRYKQCPRCRGAGKHIIHSAIRMLTNQSRIYERLGEPHFITPASTNPETMASLSNTEEIAAFVHRASPGTKCRISFTYYSHEMQPRPIKRGQTAAQTIIQKWTTWIEKAPVLGWCLSKYSVGQTESVIHTDQVSFRPCLDIFVWFVPEIQFRLTFLDPPPWPGDGIINDHSVFERFTPTLQLECIRGNDGIVPISARILDVSTGWRQKSDWQLFKNIRCLWVSEMLERSGVSIGWFVYPHLYCDPPNMILSDRWKNVEKVLDGKRGKPNTVRPTKGDRSDFRTRKQRFQNPRFSRPEQAITAANALLMKSQTIAEINQLHLPPTSRKKDKYIDFYEEFIVRPGFLIGIGNKGGTEPAGGGGYTKANESLTGSASANGYIRIIHDKRGWFPYQSRIHSRMIKFIAYNGHYAAEW